MATTSSTSNNIVNTLGAGSGIDIKALATNLVEAEKSPRKTELDKKIAKSEARISGYGALLAGLSVIKTAFQGIENPSSILKPTVDNGNPSSVSITAAATAPTGSNSLRVMQLALPQRSVSGTFASSESPINGGAPFSLQLSVNGGAAQTIRVPAAAATPSGIVAAINGTKLGLRATLVNKADGSANPYSILVTGDTGASKSFTLSSDDGSGQGEQQKMTFKAATATGNIKVAGVNVAVSAGDSAATVAAKVKTALDADPFIASFSGRSTVNNGDGSLQLRFPASDGNMTDVGFADTDGTGVTGTVTTPVAFTAGNAIGGVAFTQSQAAQDAQIELNGIVVRRSSNQVKDLIAGLTLDLKQPSDTASTIQVTGDTSGVKEKIQALVKSYNDTISDIGVLTGPKNTKDPTDVYSGSLQGDTTASTMKNMLRSMFTGNSSTASGNVKALRDLGISLDQTGVMSLDETKLNNALASNPDQVVSMLTANKENKTYTGDATRGFAGDAIKKLNDMLSSKSMLNTQTTNQNTQIKKYKDDLTKLDDRMTRLLDRYMKQFTAMETIVGQSNAMRTSLKNQFDNMSAANEN